MDDQLNRMGRSPISRAAVHPRSPRHHEIEVRTNVSKDYSHEEGLYVLLIVALGGYLSLVLVGGRMLAMMYNAIMEKCCGKEMYPEEAEMKRFRESRMSAGGADAKSIEMSNPMHPIH